MLGRPDACKRGFVSVLLRLVEPRGVVRIDGMDISEIGLRDLRERIGHVSQDPVLFGGSLRRNLDPFTRFPDANLWKALEGVHLKEKVESLPEKLYADMSEFGNNFNTGERQLLGLARALMKNVKIVVFEESASLIFNRYFIVIAWTFFLYFNRNTPTFKKLLYCVLKAALLSEPSLFYTMF